MAHGIPRGKVDETFQKRVNDLEMQAREQSEQFRQGAGTRPWHTPTSMVNTSLLDVPNLHRPAWDRDALNQNYSIDILNLTPSAVGTSGDLAGVKKQIDFMTVEERAWRLRHASLPRCATLMHGRLAMHGVANAGIFSMVRNVVQNHLLDGQNPGSRTQA